MPEYRITEKAGRFVAGRNNTGVGTPLFLTEKEAEYELSLGTIVAADHVFPDASEQAAGGGDHAPDLSKLNKAELLALAKERGVAVEESATKAQIIEALNAAAAAA